MISTIRGWFARLLSTEVGVLGGRLDDLQAAYDALSEDYSAFKENTTRTLKRVGMRWARSGGNGGGADINELLMDALKRSRREHNPFSDD